MIPFSHWEGQSVAGIQAGKIVHSPLYSIQRQNHMLHKNAKPHIKISIIIILFRQPGMSVVYAATTDDHGLYSKKCYSAIPAIICNMVYFNEDGKTPGGAYYINVIELSLLL